MQKTELELRYREHDHLINIPIIDSHAEQELKGSHEQTRQVCRNSSTFDIIRSK